MLPAIGGLVQLIDGGEVAELVSVDKGRAITVRTPPGGEAAISCCSHVPMDVPFPMLICTASAPQSQLPGRTIAYRGFLEPCAFRLCCRRQRAVPLLRLGRMRSSRDRSFLAHLNVWRVDSSHSACEMRRRPRDAIHIL